MKILLMEDDPVLSSEISNFLKKNDIECDYVYDGDLFIRKFETTDYHVFILDINVPKINGIEICKLIRKKNNTTPILVLTAFEALDDKMDAFNAGADDYLVKPFHFEELIARLKVLHRRAEPIQNNANNLRISDLIVNLDRKEVYRNEKLIELTPKEFKLLCILMENEGRVLSKQEISEKLWDYHIETSINTIEVYINFLRKKIDSISSDKLIHTKIGFGYYMQST